MKINILGSGQDAGIPHTGCYCDNCSRAREDVKYRRLGPSMAVFDEIEDFCYLIDASPDFKYQMDRIMEEFGKTRKSDKIPISGILLTHAHLGHCSGLWHLGKEGLDEKDLPVFCTPKMKQLLESNYPFSLLVQNNNIEIREITPDEELELGGIKFVPNHVPHRNEAADTVGYIIKSKKRAIYIPDIDQWTGKIIDEIKTSDIAIIDGTFFSKEEISRYDDVPHPPIRDTISLLEDADTKIYLTHINHTNPVNRAGKERKAIEENGFKIAYDGMIIEI